MKKLLFFIFLSMFSLVGHSQPYKTLNEYKKYLLENSDNLDFLEGVWEINVNWNTGMTSIKKEFRKHDLPPFNINIFPYKIAIIKLAEDYYKCYSINHLGKIYEGENFCFNFIFKPTAIEGQYIYETPSKCDREYRGNAIIGTNGDLIFEGKYEKIESETLVWDKIKVSTTKLSPTTNEIKRFKSGQKKPDDEPQLKTIFGTGSAITRDLVITCYHVVENTKKIAVRGVGGRMDTAYSASVNYLDKEMDIAILKLNLNKLQLPFTLPYSFNPKKSEVGEQIFVLGYPLQSTMGQEIKLTTGVISSNSGFLGDTSLFQISAPIQPGNSGGPLFDNYGNMIGVITAKHLNADNVGYALKINLLSDILAIKGIKRVNSKPTATDLRTKVKTFKNYIYSIESSF
jgi:hypothetical protein